MPTLSKRDYFAIRSLMGLSGSQPAAHRISMRRLLSARGSSIFSCHPSSSKGSSCRARASTEWRVSHAVLNLAFEVQERYFNIVATEKKIVLMEDFVEACDAAQLISAGQLERGTINSLERDRRKNELLEAQLELSRMRLEDIHHRQHMNVLLGVSPLQSSWTVSGQLFSLPEDEISTSDLEAIALTQRLDLKDAYLELERLERMRGLTEWWTHTDGTVGISAERDPEGARNLGPTLAGSLPLFNYGQADRARLSAQYQQKLHLLEALSLQIAAEVRSAKEQLMIHRSLVETYQKQALPLQRQIVSMSQRFYNAMALGVYQLLDTKKQEIQLNIDLLMALKGYWIARVTLNKVVGGYLPIAPIAIDHSLEKK